jgi:hypothetical protein
MPTDPEDPFVEQLDIASKEAIKKLHSLVDDLKSVQEHEKSIVDDEPPFFRRA